MFACKLFIDLFMDIVEISLHYFLMAVCKNKVKYENNELIFVYKQKMSKKRHYVKYLLKHCVNH